MANTQKVDEIISDKALDSMDTLSAKLAIAITGFEKLVQQAVALNGAFGKTNTFKGTNEGIEKLTANEKAFADVTKQLETAQAKLNATFSTQAEQLAQAKVAQGVVTAQLKDQAKEALGLVGAYDRLNAQAKAATKEYQNAAAAFKDASAAGKLNAEQLKAQGDAVTALGKKADGLNQNLKDIDAKAGLFQRNVGNYAGSLGGAFATLQKELQNVKTQIQQTDATGANFESLVKQETLLETLTQNLGKGFKSTQQELRAYEKAAKDLGVQFGLTSETFQLFAKEVGDVKNEVQDISATLKFNASDTKFLDGAISAVQGLAGVYGVAQGAAALFGQGEEELQKEMVKLQAIMTIIQSLQQVTNALQTESGAVQTFLAGRTALLNAGIAIQNRLYGVKAAVLAPVIIEEEAASVASTELAGAMVAEAAATEAATTATVGFTAAFAATGIGALILAVAAALVYVASKIPDWLRGTRLSIQAQGDLADALQKTRQAMIDYATQIEKTDGAVKKFYENQLALSQAAGRNAYEQFAIQKNLVKEELNLANQQIEALGATAKSQADLQGEVEKYTNRRVAALDLLSEAIRTHNKDDIEQYNKLIDFYDKQIGANQGLADAQRKALDDRNTSIQKAAQLEIAQRKFAADEARKIVLAEADFEATAIQNRNARVLADEASTQKQRLAAIKSNAAAERALAIAQRNDVSIDNGDTPEAVRIAEEKKQAAIREIDKKSANDIFLLNREYAAKDREARLAELNTRLNDAVTENDAIVDNEKKSFDDRLTALYTSLRASQALLNANHEEELKQLGLTAEQRKAIEVKFYSDSNALLVEAGLKQLSLYKNNADLINAQLEKDARRREDIQGGKGGAAIAALNKQVIEGFLTFNQYSRKRADQEAANAVESTRVVVDNQTAITNATKAGTAERDAAERDLKDKTIAYGDAIIAAKKLQNAETVADLEKIKGYADTVLDLIGGAIDASIDAQKNALKDQSDQIDKVTQQQIEAVNASTDTEEKKAARIAIINARAQAQKEAIDRRQKQLDIQKAQFDKAKSIVDIILNTAIAVVKALGEGGPVLAAVYAAIGAAQLVVAIATPIPKFEKGTLDAPGGDALVGDGYRSEMVVTPDGRLLFTPSSPTVMNIPEHSVIFPDARAMMEAGVGNGGRVPTISESRAIYEGLNNTLGGKLDKLTKVVANKTEWQVTVRKEGWSKIKKGRQGTTKYLNN